MIMVEIPLARIESEVDLLTLESSKDEYCRGALMALLWILHRVDESPGQRVREKACRCEQCSTKS